MTDATPATTAVFNLLCLVIVVMQAWARFETRPWQRSLTTRVHWRTARTIHIVVNLCVFIGLSACLYVLGRGLIREESANAAILKQADLAMIPALAAALTAWVLPQVAIVKKWEAKLRRYCLITAGVPFIAQQLATSLSVANFKPSKEIASIVQTSLRPSLLSAL